MKSGGKSFGAKEIEQLDGTVHSETGDGHKEESASQTLGLLRVRGGGGTQRRLKQSSMCVGC